MIQTETSLRKRCSACAKAAICTLIVLTSVQSVNADFVVVPSTANYIEAESGGILRQGLPEQLIDGSGLNDGPYVTGEVAPVDVAGWSQVDAYGSGDGSLGFMNWSDGATNAARCAGGDSANCDPNFSNHSTLVFGLPGTAEISEVVIWNGNGVSWNSRGWDDIEIFASTDGGSSFGSALTVGGNANPLVGDYSGNTTQDAIVLALDAPVMADAIKLRGFTAASHPKLTELLFTSTAPIPGTDLLLQVNPVTGATRMINQTTDPIEIDFYQIESASGALSTGGWSSLDDAEGTDPPGAGWVEAGGSGANILGEGSLDRTVFLGQDDTLSLGSLFDPNAPGAEQDLLFKVGLAAGTSQFGSVEYVEFTEFLDADFNQDTTVDGTDLGIWASAYGTNADGDANSNGVTEGHDFLIWQRQHGQSSALSASVAAVPEPALAVLILPALLLPAFVRSRSRLATRVIK